MKHDEFYVGYLETSPPAQARFTRSRATFLGLLAAACALVLVASQRPFSGATFEFGTETELEGVITSTPVPTLLVERPGALSDAAPGRSRYLLVTFGKFGAAELAARHDGERVRLAGTLVYRGGQTMVEVVDGSLEVLSDDAPVPDDERRDLGIHTLRGEIVDSKCFLGVMKPGNLKPHRACATRCISGGVPPVLLVRDEQGRASYFLLVGAEGEAVNAHILDHVAEPVEITGRVLRYQDQLVLSAAPSTYRRLAGP